MFRDTFSSEDSTFDPMYHISKLSSGYGLNSCALCWDDLYSSKDLTTIIYIDTTFGFLVLLWGSATIGLKLVPARLSADYCPKNINGLGGDDKLEKLEDFAYTKRGNSAILLMQSFVRLQEFVITSL